MSSRLFSRFIYFFSWFLRHSIIFARGLAPAADAALPEGCPGKMRQWNVHVLYRKTHALIDGNKLVSAPTVLSPNATGAPFQSRSVEERVMAWWLYKSSIGQGHTGNATQRGGSLHYDYFDGSFGKYFTR